MKLAIGLLSMIVSVSAFAANLKPSEVIKKNIEVQSAIAAFEKNRNQRCEELTDAGVKVVGKDGQVQAQISCNEYDENGEPQANVYFIKIKGLAYDESFDLDSIAFVGAE